jgi:hypothetical protein
MLQDQNYPSYSYARACTTRYSVQQGQNIVEVACIPHNQVVHLSKFGAISQFVNGIDLGGVNLLTPADAAQLNQTSDTFFQKFIDLHNLNEKFSNQQLRHFDIRDIAVYQKDDSLFVQVLQRSLLGQSPMKPHYSFDLVNVLRYVTNTFSCQNDRTQTDATAALSSVPTHFTNNDRSIILFQTMYMKHMLTKAGYVLDPRHFLASICLVELPAAQQFSYYLDQIQYSFQTQYFLTLSIKYIEAWTQPAAARASVAKKVTRQTLKAVSTSALLYEVIKEFNKDITLEDMYTFVSSLDVKSLNATQAATAPPITITIFDNFDISLATAPATAPTFWNFTADQLQQINQLNKQLKERIQELNDDYTHIQAISTTTQASNQLLLEKQALEQQKKNEKRTLIKELITIKNSVDKELNLQYFLLSYSTLLEKNRDTYRHNLYSNIFLTTGK